MLILDLLTDQEIKSVLDAVGELSYADGKNTASGRAKALKQNLQITRGDPKAVGLINRLESRVRNASKVDNYAMIKHMVATRIVNYRDGGHYGWHVDLAFMQGRRTDLSYTIFLNDPESYEGGELQIDLGGTVRSFKPKKGQILLYPTGRLHQVTPVTRGERLVIVGWIESCIPNEEDRLAILRMNTEIERIGNLLRTDQNHELNPLRYLLQTFRRRLNG